LAVCEGIVRAHDPDRFMASLFAPAAKRPFLHALYAFNHEIAHVAEVVTQPMLGEIRLQWWRETVEQARAGRPRDHAVGRALALAFAASDLPQAPFDAMLDARTFDATPDIFESFEALEDYADATAGNLARLAAKVLDGAPHDALAREAGIAYALIGLVRAIPFHAARRKIFLPAELLARHGLGAEEIFAGRGQDRLRGAIAEMVRRARSHLDAARRGPRPGRALAAFLPAAAVPVQARIVARPSFDPFRDASGAPLYRRQLAMLGASLRGHL
jgi:phytoene synthase